MELWRARSRQRARTRSHRRQALLARGTIDRGERMSGVKRAVLDLVRALPDDCTLEDVQYKLYVRQKVEGSMQAAAEGACSATSR